MLRWILSLAALALAAWYLNNRRRARGQDSLYTTVPTNVKAAGEAMAEAAQDRAGAAAEAVRSTVEQAQQAAETARQKAGDAISTLQEQARAAAESATQQVQATLETVSEQEAPATGQEEGTPAPESVAPVGERPRPIAGEGTTTPSGEPVNPLSATPDGATATGQPEPLPRGLTAGEAGTGGPAGSAQAPSTPDSTETPTTGMEQPPVIDRAAEVAERTSGAFVGNKSTRVFHAAGSGHLPAKNKRVYFESAEEAVAAGFRPAEGEGLEESTNA